MKMEKKLQYKDEEGNIGVGNTLTDLERNNRLIDKGIKVLVYFAALLTAVFAVMIWLIYYIITNSVLNNIVANCVC